MKTATIGDLRNRYADVLKWVAPAKEVAICRRAQLSLSAEESATLIRDAQSAYCSGYMILSSDH